jgi:hypothetical protein
MELTTVIASVITVILLLILWVNGRFLVLRNCTCHALQCSGFLSLLVHPMSSLRAPLSTMFGGAGQDEPYRDNPTMIPPQTTGIRSLDLSYTEPSEQTPLSFDNSVSLTPTLGTVSPHPTYVRPRSLLMKHLSIFAHFPYFLSCRNRLCYDFVS